VGARIGLPNRPCPVGKSSFYFSVQVRRGKGGTFFCIGKPLIASRLQPADQTLLAATDFLDTELSCGLVIMPICFFFPWIDKVRIADRIEGARE